MATKVFSSRADAGGLAYADAVARERFGMSFGQYCGSVLVEAVRQGAELPSVPQPDGGSAKARAIASIKAIASRPHDAAVGRMTDEEIDDLLASRYA